MPSIIEEIKTRRSIRKYKPQSVPEEVVFRVIESAAYAPSAHNSQPWRFIVLTEPARKKTLAEAIAQVWLRKMEHDQVPEKARLETIKASVERYIAAPVLILACLTLEKMDEYTDVERQRIERDLGVQSLAAAIQTLLLAAHANGLGSCWYCAPMFCKEAVRQAMEIPSEVEPQALISLGYPAEMPSMPLRMVPEDFIFKNKWNNPM